MNKEAGSQVTLKKTRILVVDTLEIIRRGIEACLDDLADIEIVDMVASGREALQLARTKDVHVIVTDLATTDMTSIQLIREICQRDLSARVVIFTEKRTGDFVSEAFRTGATGYLLKDASRIELITAIRSVRDGLFYISPAIASVGVAAMVKQNPHDPVKPLLTYRELEIIRHIAGGKKSNEISKDLNLSVKTVEKHRSNMMKKLDLHSAAELTRYAVEMGLTV